MMEAPISNIFKFQEVGSLSSKAKMAMKIFVKRVFTIFATNASFLCVILISRQNSVCSGLKFSSESKLFGEGPTWDFWKVAKMRRLGMTWNFFRVFCPTFISWHLYIFRKLQANYGLKTQWKMLHQIFFRKKSCLNPVTPSPIVCKILRGTLEEN